MTAVTTSDVAVSARGGESPGRRFVRRFRTERTAVAALITLLVIIVCAIAAPILAPHDPDAQSLTDRLAAPGPGHWLGTDDLGRDVLSRLLFGSRVELVAALQATAVGVALGVPLGLVSGYVGGWLDMFVGRIADAIMSIPALLLAMSIVGVLGPNMTNAMVAIGIVYAPRLFRIVRAAVLEVREETFVEASRGVGARPARIIGGHVLPNVLSPLIVQVSISMGYAILFGAGLSFLGMGVQPPDSSWGTMLGRSTRFLEESPHLATIPGVAILITVLAFNVLGDGIRDSLGKEVRRE